MDVAGAAFAAVFRLPRAVAPVFFLVVLVVPVLDPEAPVDVFAAVDDLAGLRAAESRHRR